MTNTLQFKHAKAELHALSGVTAAARLHLSLLQASSTRAAAARISTTAPVSPPATQSASALVSAAMSHTAQASKISSAQDNEHAALDDAGFLASHGLCFHGAVDGACPAKQAMTADAPPDPLRPTCMLCAQATTAQNSSMQAHSRAAAPQLTCDGSGRAVTRAPDSPSSWGGCVGGLARAGL